MAVRGPEADIMQPHFYQPALPGALQYADLEIWLENFRKKGEDLKAEKRWIAIHQVPSF
jgi:hypothetical protein